MKGLKKEGITNSFESGLQFVPKKEKENVLDSGYRFRYFLYDTKWSTAN